MNTAHELDQLRADRLAADEEQRRRSIEEARPAPDIAAAARLLSVPPREINSVEHLDSGDLLIRGSGNEYVVVPEDTPDGAGRSGLMLRTHPVGANGEPAQISLPVFTPRARERTRRREGRAWLSRFFDLRPSRSAEPAASTPVDTDEPFRAPTPSTARDELHRALSEHEGRKAELRSLQDQVAKLDVAEVEDLAAHETQIEQLDRRVRFDEQRGLPGLRRAAGEERHLELLRDQHSAAIRRAQLFQSITPHVEQFLALADEVGAELDRFDLQESQPLLVAERFVQFASWLRSDASTGWLGSHATLPGAPDVAAAADLASRFFAESEAVTNHDG